MVNIKKWKPIFPIREKQQPDIVSICEENEALTVFLERTIAERNEAQSKVNFFSFAQAILCVSVFYFFLFPLLSLKKALVMEQISDEAKKRNVEGLLEQNVRLQESMKKLESLEEKIAALERAKPVPKKSRYIVSTTNDQVQIKYSFSFFLSPNQTTPTPPPPSNLSGQSRCYKEGQSNTEDRHWAFREKDWKFKGWYFWAWAA